MAPTTHDKNPPEVYISALTESMRALVRELARDIAKQVIDEHVDTCPAHGLEPRVRAIEARWAYFAGAVIGAGGFGGISGALLTKLMGG